MGEKKGFLGKLMAKVDGKLEEDSKKSCCCCDSECKPKKEQDKQ